MKRKTITVVMPNYNYSKFLKTSISAILNQTRKPDKFIIIDDASTDDSVLIIKDLTKNTSNVLFLQNSKNLGVVPTVNEVSKYVETDYVFFTASDDFISPDFIYETMAFVEQNEDIGICTTIPAFFTNSQKIWADDLGIYEKKIFQVDELINEMKKTKFWIATHASIIITKDFKKQLLEDKLKSYSDWFWILNIAFENKVGFIPKPLAFMRIHCNSYSAKKRSYNDSKELFSFLMNTIESNKDDLQQKYIKARSLSSLDKNNFFILLNKIKFWKYLPSFLFGKFLRNYIRIKRKFKKIFFKKIDKYDFDKIRFFIQKNE